MPFRRAQPPPDIERVARILGWAGDRDPASELDAGKPAESSARKPGRWIPDAPEIDASVTLPGRPTRSLVEQTRSRLTGGGDRARASTVAPRAAPGPGRSALDLLDADLRRARRPGFVTAPEPLVVGRWAVSNGTVVALIALVVAVGCVLAVRVLWAERSAGAGAAPSERAAPVSHGVVVTGADGATAPALIPSGGSSGAASGGGSRGGATASGVAAASGAGASGAAATAAAAATGVATAGAVEIVVHVVGQVVRPGLVRLRPGARVADAVAAAGGAGPNADLAALNLARLVVDGERLPVPRPGEVVAAPPAPGPAPSGDMGPGPVPGGSGAALVSLNSADLAALDTLPGVGPVLAQRIIDWRTQHGRFTSIDELGEVSGIGEKLLAQLGTRVAL